ncbi:MAG: hypothetical protein K9G70_01495 [Prolixibacteraceae bacterium]|nr:hypothetical protein [Prolixibacteraceae bacterium]
MQQLLNWTSVEDANLYGVYGMALDPQNENHIFLSAGRYPFAQPADVFESFDKGETFLPLGLNKPMGANTHPEKVGEKLMLNPFDNNDLWCATFGEGLWIYSIDSKKWKKSVFKSKSNIQSMMFDHSRKSTVYISTVEDGIFYSTDSGSSFQKIEGYAWDNTEIALNEEENILFASSRNDGIRSLKNPTTNSTWNNITPDLKNSDYRTISFSKGVLATAPGKPMGSLLWGFYTSKDNGLSWEVKPTKIKQHIKWHQKLFPGSAISDIVFDPNNPNRILISDWFSVFETKNFNSDTVVWSNQIAKGHEEVVCLNMAALPKNETNISLYSAHADIAGFAHVKSDTIPYNIFKSSYGQNINNLTGLAFCETKPNIVYSLGSEKHGGELACLAKSTDFGKNWEVLSAYKSDWGWGRIAVSPTLPERIVLSTQHHGVLFSDDGGFSFKNAQDSPENLISGPVFRYNYILCADKVDANWFYIYSRNDSSFYRSNDYGESWTKMNAKLPVPARKFFEAQLDVDYWRLESVSGHAGHLFLSLANEGLYFTSNRGESWKKIESIESVPLMGLGAPKSEKAYPTLYVLGQKADDSALWYYRSTDMGKTFQRINSEKERIGNNPQFIEGDRQIFGRVYIGTNGSGIVVGELK